MPSHRSKHRTLPKRSNSRSVSPRGTRSQQYSKCEYDSVSGGYRLYVCDLHDSTSSGDLDSLFSKYGKLRERVYLSRSNPSFGFVVFKYEKDAIDACNSLNNVSFQGARIGVSFAKSRNSGYRSESPSRGSKRNSRSNFVETRSCYTCGKTGHISRDCPPQRSGRNLFYSPSRSRSPSPYHRRSRHDSLSQCGNRHQRSPRR